MKKYATTLLIWASLIIGELHTLFEKVEGKYNWIVADYKPMKLSWNFKYAADQIWFILIGFAVLFYTPNRINKTTVQAYIAFCFVDICMYFYNYKQQGYEAIYTLLMIFWIIIFNKNGSSRPTNGQGIVITA